MIASRPCLSLSDRVTSGALVAVLSWSRRLSTGQADVVPHFATLRRHGLRCSLAVPAIAALGGFLFLSESADLRLLAAGSLILGGIGLTILFKPKA